MTGSLTQTNLSVQPAGTTQLQVSVPNFGVPTLAAGQTIKYGYGAGTGAAQTAATVTTGKTAYVYSVAVQGTASDYFLLRDPSDTNVFLNMRFLANTTAIMPSAIPIAVYTSGQNIRVLCATTSAFTIIYIEM